MAGPWEKYSSQPRTGSVYTLPEAPDPDKALRHQMLQLDLEKKAKDAAKEQVGDKEVHALATLYANNKMVPPSRPNEVAQKAVAEAMMMDPNYDPALAPNRVGAIKDFTGAGKASSAIGAVNRLAENLQELKSISDKMGGPNLRFKPLNRLVAGVEQSGEPELTSRYDALLPEIANQFDLIMKSNKGSPTVSGTEEVTKGLNRTRSQAERDAAFQEVAKAVHGAITPLKDQWNSAYGGSKAPPMWISKGASDFFSSIDPQHSDDYGGNDWRGLPGLKGDGTPGQATGLGGNPPGGPGGPPPPAAPGSPSLTPAGGATKTEITRGPLDAKISAMLSGGTPSAQIRKFAQDNGYTQNLDSVLAFRAMHPTYRGGYDVHQEKIVPTTAYNRAAASPLAAGALAAADAGTAGLTDEATGAVNALRTGQPLGEAIQSADYGKQMLANANPGATLAGNVVGGIGATLGGGLALRGALGGTALGRGALEVAARNPIKAAALGDAAYGAAYGAGENNDNRGLGAGIGGVTGLIASPIGAGLAKGAGSVIQGVADPAVQRLRALGIPLTVGETLGGGFKKAQDAMTSVFGPGNMVARRYADGRRALNEAAFNTAGQTIDTPINAVGQQGISALDTAKSQAYSKALDPVSLNLNTPSFIDPMRGVLSAASEIPQGELPQGYAANTINRFVGNNISADGTMSGSGFQKAYRGLAQTANRASGKVEGHDIGMTLGQAKDILSSTLQDQNPGAYEGFLKANSANRHLNVLANAVNSAKNQVSDNGEILFTPAQLGTAATANAKSFTGNIAAASGARPFNQLAQDAQQVMSSKLPESGTFPRALMGAALMGGGGGLGYGSNGTEGAVEGAAAPLALTSLLGTKFGQQLLVSAMLKRTLADQAAGQAIKRNPQVGASFLTSLGVPMLTSPAQ